MSEKIELSKEQMIAVKKGHIENDICGDLATPFAQLMCRGIWLWHDTIKGVCRSIKSQEVRDKVDKGKPPGEFGWFGFYMVIKIACTLSQLQAFIFAGYLYER